MKKRISKNKNKTLKKSRYAQISELNRRVHEEVPKSGEYLYNYKIDIIKQENQTLSEHDLRKKLKLDFRDIPITSKTMTRLRKRGFRMLTEIQRCVIPHALVGRDILAASKTGSGKTLSFLIPIIENLLRKKWTVLDGLGALIIVPTRELAIQIFEVIKSILENNHDLTYGLVIGGKNLEVEQSVIHRMNILVATPGRLLQHFTETIGFEAGNLQMLVLDEADEILSMGFEQTIEGILDNIDTRQTQNMFFSATLTKKILKISKVNLKKPENVFLHSKHIKAGDVKNVADIYETPSSLK